MDEDEVSEYVVERSSEYGVAVELTVGNRSGLGHCNWLHIASSLLLRICRQTHKWQLALHSDMSIVHRMTSSNLVPASTSVAT